MTYARRGTISVDQFIDAPPSKVWRALTEPPLHEKWWAPGDIAESVGHEFHLQMPGFGPIPCKVVESERHKLFAYTFNGVWRLTWRLIAEGNGTRLVLEHSGFDLDDKRDRDACERMGPGWRDEVLPRLARFAPAIDAQQTTAFP